MDGASDDMTTHGMQSELSCLPITGLFYRFGVDLCGPLEETKLRNTYIMICIDHYSKWIQVILIPDKSSAVIAYAFHTNVLSRYGGCGEFITDQGTEFQGAF